MANFDGAVIATKLAEITGYPIENIDQNTRLYHDAGLSGDDFYDFIIWYSHYCNVGLSGMNVSKFSPPDGLSIWPFRRRYFELKISDLEVLSTAGDWRESRLERVLKKS